MENSVPVTHTALLKGAWYAIEQAGCLLQHAEILHRARAYSTAAALALIAREELGKYLILRDYWRNTARGGAPPTVKTIRAVCDDHIEKQRRATLSITFTAEPPSALDRILRERFKLHPQSPGYKMLDKTLGFLLAKTKKRLPEDRHSARIRALYVDPTSSGADWHRPGQLSAAEATRHLTDATNDYAVQRNRLCPELLADLDPEFAAALGLWPERPDLTEPVWPHGA